MPADVAIDGTRLTLQPSRMEVIEAAAPRRQVSTGGFIFSPRAKGRIIRLVFGIDAAKLGVLDALRAARSGVIAHTLQWTDPDGNNFDININWDADPSYNIGTDFSIERFVVTLYERPD